MIKIYKGLVFISVLCIILCFTDCKDKPVKPDVKVSEVTSLDADTDKNGKENQRFQSQIKINKIPVEWNLDAGKFYCAIEGEYPQIDKKDSTSIQINKLIHEWVYKKIDNSKEFCKETDSEDIEPINGVEQRLSISYDGGGGGKIISLGIYSSVRPLGAAVSTFDSQYYNYNYETNKEVLFSDIFELNDDLKKIIFTEFESRCSYSIKDSLELDNYLNKSSAIKYLIDQYYLEISFDNLSTGLYCMLTKEDYIDLRIEDISKFLKIPIEDLLGL